MDGSCRVVEAGPAREHYVPLLELADGSAQQVRSYLHDGDLYVYREAGTEVGVVLVIPRDAGTVELKTVAVDATHQGRGVGRRMLRAVLDALRLGGVSRVVVGTASSSIGPLAFYQKAGFRFLGIERDYFREGRGYPRDLREDGIPVRDMVWMDQWLAGIGPSTSSP